MLDAVTNRSNSIKLFFAFSIMGKSMLPSTITILSIIIVIKSNLIRLGDFQNLVTFPLGRDYAFCNNDCNGTWFSSNGYMELGIGPYTTTVDMKNFINYKLCQNVSSMEIGKTYIFTFDMLCIEYFYKNCSIWVIVNNQVVNGSNHTSYDFVSHKVVGYFNSTKLVNKICFQSSEAPDQKYYGSRLDNVTLQRYDGIIACNVLNCKLCVLNLPNSCYTCQNGFVKQPNQTCAMCSTFISNCVRCQRINNQYKCNQCSSQFQLNIQRNFCYQNSEIFFTSEVSETASIDNSFIIKTNLSIALLIQAGFSIQNLPSIMIKINDDRQQNLTITLNEEGFLQVKFNIATQYQNFNINFEVQQGFIQINNTYFSIRTQVQKKPSVFLSETQIAIFQKYDELAKPIIYYLDATFAIIKNSGLGFFIANIFNYLSLMTFYSYLNVYQPKNFRLFIEILSSQLNSYSLYKLINLQTQVYEIAQYQVVEKIKASKQDWLGPLQTGFSTNFYKNNLQPFTIIAIFALRLLFCWILHKIFKARLLYSSSSQRFMSISSQFHTIIPIAILPSFNLIIKSISSIDYAEKINTILHIIILFICLLIPFVHFIIQIRKVGTKNSKDRKKLQIKLKKSKLARKNEILQFEIDPSSFNNQQVQKEFESRRKQLNQQQKNRLMQTKLKLVQRLKLLSIPIFVVFQQVLPFLLINLCLLLISLLISLKLKNYFSIYQFFFNTTISLAWLLLHCFFCIFSIIQKWFFEQGSASPAVQIQKYVSYSTIIIILFGAVLQMLDCLIGLVNFFRQIVTYFYQKYKRSIKTTPQNQKFYKTKHQNVFRNYNSNPKQENTVKKVVRLNTNNEQNSSNPAINHNSLNFYQPQACNKRTKISKNNSVRPKRKIKKTKQQGKNYQLKVKFQSQNKK